MATFRLKVTQCSYRCSRLVYLGDVLASVGDALHNLLFGSLETRGLPVHNIFVRIYRSYLIYG
jgi:hypothetical protein